MRYTPWLVRPWVRSLLSFAVMVLVYRAWSTQWWELRILLAFDLGLLLHLAILGFFMWQATPEQTYRYAQRGEPSTLGLLTIVVLFSLSSLLGVAIMLDNSQKYPPLVTNAHLGLSLLAVFLSWLIVHTYYAIHYARLYYDEVQHLPQVSDEALPYVKGLEFPHDGLVSYRDFLYYSFTIAMCYQTSDVSILSYEMRSLSLVQAVLGFIFVAVIFGLVVNIVSNLA